MAKDHGNGFESTSKNDQKWTTKRFKDPKLWEDFRILERSTHQKKKTSLQQLFSEPPDLDPKGLPEMAEMNHDIRIAAFLKGWERLQGMFQSCVISIHFEF